MRGDLVDSARYANPKCGSLLSRTRACYGRANRRRIRVGALEEALMDGRHLDRRDLDRRHLLKAGGASLAVSAAAPLALFDPRAARAQGAPFAVLSPDEVTTIEALSDALVPGA